MSRLFLAIFCGVLLVATGCSKPKPSPYTSGNYPGSLKIGTPYEIDGRTYYPAHDPNYVEEGVASWYGPGFHGRSTANGERFDQNEMTAAHRTLPLPSMVKVTNLDNGKTAVLKVNDRGPFKKDRIIDLSKKSAEVLGIIGHGTGNVRVQYLPQETRQLITELIQTNKLKVDSKTLAELKMSDIPVAAADAPPPPPPAKEVTMAMAMVEEGEPAQQEEKKGGFFSRATKIIKAPARLFGSPVEETASLSPVAARNLAAPPAEAAAAPSTVSARKSGAATAVNTELDEIKLPTRKIRSAPISTQAAAPAAPVEAEPLTPAIPLPEEPVVEPLQASLRPASTPSAPTASAAALPAASGLFVQAGSFTQAENAHALAEKLARVGRTSVKPVDINGRTWYRVRVGPMPNHAQAGGLLQQVQSLGLHDARIIRD